MVKDRLTREKKMARKAKIWRWETWPRFTKSHEKITPSVDRLIIFNRKLPQKLPDGRPINYFYFPQDGTAESRAAYYGLSLNDLLAPFQKYAKKARFPRKFKFIAVMAGTEMMPNEIMYGLPTKWSQKILKSLGRVENIQNKFAPPDYVRDWNPWIWRMTAYVVITISMAKIKTLLCRYARDIQGTLEYVGLRNF